MIEVWLWTQKQDIGPSARGWQTMVYDSEGKKTLLFGGYDLDLNKRFNDTWEWDGTEWTQVADTGPLPRGHHDMVFDSERKRAVLFGGADFVSQIFNDTWEWDGKFWTPSRYWSIAQGNSFNGL